MDRFKDRKSTTSQRESDSFAIDNGFWVFGYGSLMWNPGFRHIDKREAVLRGFARRFCLWSIRYRGTPEAPGLVLGLTQAKTASTRGVAYRVGPKDADEAMAYLREREMVTDAYREAREPVEFLCRPTSPERDAVAVAYVIDPKHRQFAGVLSLEEQAAIIANRVGPAGANAEYLFNTVAHLRSVGVRDTELERLEELVRVQLESDRPPK